MGSGASKTKTKTKIMTSTKMQRGTTCFERRRRIAWWLIFLAGAAGLGLAGCAHNVQLQEVSRLSSPDHTSDAVVLRSSSDKPVSAVYLTLPGSSIQKGSQVFKGTEVEGLSVKWLSESRLEVRYRSAQIKYFHPTWEHAGHTVRIWMIEEHELSD